jgi:hypothetical protein
MEAFWRTALPGVGQGDEKIGNFARIAKFSAWDLTPPCQFLLPGNLSKMKRRTVAKTTKMEKIYCQEVNMSSKKFLIAILLIVFATLACRGNLPQKQEAAPPSEVYLGLRDIWFTSTPEETGISVDPNSTTPYAVVMDIGFEEGTTTIVSSIAGDGSMYTSSGGGIIGGIDQETVRTASIGFVETAQDFVDHMELVTEYPLPGAENIKFYLITLNGVFTTEEVNADLLASGDHELSPLFYAGNDVITELRLISGE